MRKIVATAMKKLELGPIHTLSADEFRAYFEYRIKNTLAKKFALVENELEYLLCETGPGNLRTDPEFLPLITRKKAFVNKDSRYQDTESLLNKKIKAENYINENVNSPQTQQLVFNVISGQIGQAKITSIKPFVISGYFEGIPVSCLIENGKWLFPDTELFGFLKNCQSQKTFPILISKKISGILFPVFKNISVLGLNTYKTLLPKAGESLIEEVKDKTAEFPEVKYCNQFHFFAEPGTTESNEISQGDNPIITFFETALKNNIPKYNTAFLQSKVTIANNFEDTVSQFKKNNPNKNLLKNFVLRQSLIQALKNQTQDNNTKGRP